MKFNRLAVMFGLFFGLATNSHAQNVMDKALPLDPQVRMGKLENGLTYYIRKNAEPAHRAEVYLAVNAGSFQENEDQQGLAHFTEHMAFNGTQHFEKNQLVSFLQSAGVKFGAHLNAYTSFAETVYMLSLPTDKPEVMDKGLLVLEDWAAGVAFEGEEIDKERGVVVEEWRLGQGADERMMQRTLPITYKGSRIAERLPIGKKEILEGFEHGTLRSFYKDWYRPDLMAVVVVGDIDPDAMEAQIKERFSKIPAASEPRPREDYGIPSHEDTYIAIAGDKEASMTRVGIEYIMPHQAVKTLGDMRAQVVRQLFNGMINNRLRELTQTANPPFIAGFTSYGGSYSRLHDAYQSLAIVGEGKALEGLKALLLENERVRRHGFTQGELDRYKLQLTSYYERQFNEREKTASRNYAFEYASHFLESEPAPGIEFEFAFLQQALPTIQLAEVNALIQQWITEQNRAVTITGVEKEGVALPTEADVRAMMAEVEKAEVAAYAEEEVASSLMETLPAAGRVVSERQVPATGVTEWTLSNGARVVLKPTDFKQDEITVTAFSKGGHSLVSDADYLSASNATGIISQSGVGQFSMNEMRKVLAGKSASVSPSIGTMSEGLNGQSTVKDVETMFQLMHLYFTQPRKDEEAFQSFIAKNRAFMKNIMENPMTYFSIERSRIMNGRHPRAGVFPTDEQWDQISLEAAYRVYQERFANAGDFTFIFVGSFKVEDMKPLVEQYVASLPGQPGQAEMGKDLGIRPPAGAVSEVLRKGTDPKSMVAMTYMKDAPYKGEVSFALTALAEALSIKLIETLRESEGGVYTVRASASATREPYDQYSLTFQMPCGPENAEKLTQLAMEQVERMRKSGPTPEDLHKVKEQMKRELEENLRKNDYWQRQLRNRYYYGEGTDKPMGDLAMIEALSVKGLQKVAKKFIDPKRYVRVTLMPEQP